MNQKLEKGVAGIIAIVLTIGFIVQYFIIKDRVIDGMSWLQSTVYTLKYMTIWTNILLCILFWNIALNTKNIFNQAVTLHALLVYILIVGIIYHLFIASHWTPTGKLKFTDIVFHTFAPLATLFYWIIRSAKEKISYINSTRWLFYPIIYFALAQVYSLVTGDSPYPIYDINTLSISAVMINGFLSLVLYWVIGSLVIFLNNYRFEKFSADVSIS